MGVSPKHLECFVAGDGRDLHGVELLFEESGGGLVPKIVEAEIDPIGLFRGKPFFFALLFVGFHARKTKSRLLGSSILTFPPSIRREPGEARKDAYGVPRERDEEALPDFRRLKGLDAAFENTAVPRQHGDLASPHPEFNRAADDGWEGGMVAGTQNPLQIPLFSTASRSSTVVTISSTGRF